MWFENFTVRLREATSTSKMERNQYQFEITLRWEVHAYTFERKLYWQTTRNAYWSYEIRCDDERKGNDCSKKDDNYIGTALIGSSCIGIICLHNAIYLASSHAWYALRSAMWSLWRVPENFLCTQPSLLRSDGVSNGSGKLVLAAMVHIASPQLTKKKTDEVKICRLPKHIWYLFLEKITSNNTHWKMQPRIIIFPRRGSTGSLAKM